MKNITLLLLFCYLIISIPLGSASEYGAIENQINYNYNNDWNSTQEIEEKIGITCDANVLEGGNSKIEHIPKDNTTNIGWISKVKYDANGNWSFKKKLSYICACACAAIAIVSGILLIIGNFLPIHEAPSLFDSPLMEESVQSDPNAFRGGLINISGIIWISSMTLTVAIVLIYLYLED